MKFHQLSLKVFLFSLRFSKNLKICFSGQQSVMSKLLENSFLSTLLQVNLSKQCREHVEFSILSTRSGELWALESMQNFPQILRF